MSFLRKPSDPHAVPAVFPTYLLPSLPFRRRSRHSSTDSDSSAQSSISTSTTLSTASNPFTRVPTPSPISSKSSVIIPPDDKYLSGHTSHLHCAKCSTDLCLTSQIISKGFTGRHGRAFLVQSNTSQFVVPNTTLPNTFLNKAVPRNLVTGQHTVSDVACAICGTVIGWKYVEASEESQKYKVGKFILETKKIRTGVCWENDEDRIRDGGNYDEVLPLPLSEMRKLIDGPDPGGLGSIEFDSQDEDECEDLFAGVWSQALAIRRRQRKNERFLRRGRIGSLIGGGAASSVDALS